MKFKEEYDFDHSVDSIIKMFGDKEYYLAKYERMGGDRPEVLECKEDGDNFLIAVRHALDAQKMSFPDFIKKRIGNNLMLRQKDSWDFAARKGRIDIDIEKAPVDIAAAMTLSEKNGKAHLALDFDIDASIPLIGGKIEKAVAGPIAKHIKRDLKLSNEMASDYA